MKINASPTKEFFISMLTRDIPLDRAILDLVDNSIDAAKQSGIVADKYVRLTVKKDGFSIIDNCGGMDQETAKKCAFRFGRSKDSPLTPNSVGQFGVGMKRTLFKIGKKFQVISNHNSSHFSVDVDVAEWLGSDEWEFELTELPVVKKEYGTEIYINDFNDGIAEKFDLDTFTRGLITEISESHFKVINNGINIFVNDEQVSKYEINIRFSDLLGVASETYSNKGVNVKIIAGIGERDINYGGWYVVCNGRLISFAEKSKATGWGQNGIAKYHPDYAFFRGVVDLEAEDSSKLPWTTTKTGIDVDNRAYRIALSKMTDKMRQVLAFLREREKETRDHKEEKVEITPLNDAIDHSPICNIYNTPENTEFIRPEIAERIAKPEYVNMQYPILAKKLAIVKDTTGLTSNKDAGILTFNYFFERECEIE